jgi:hypothetical protein
MTPASTGANLKKAPGRRGDIMNRKRMICLCVVHMVLASTLFFWSLYFRYTFGIYFHLLEMAIAIYVVEDYYYPYYEPGSKEALRKGWK